MASTANPIRLAEDGSESGVELMSSSDDLDDEGANGFHAPSMVPRQAPSARRHLFVVAALVVVVLTTALLTAAGARHPPEADSQDRLVATLDRLASVLGAGSDDDLLSSLFSPGGGGDDCAALGTYYPNGTAPAGDRMEVFVDYDTEEVVLAVPDALMGAPFTVIATTTRVTSLDAGLMHYGVGMDDAYFEFRAAAHKDEVHVTRPQLDVREATRRYDAGARDGFGDVGWSAALPLVEGTKGCGNTTFLRAFDWVVLEGLSVVDTLRNCASGDLVLRDAKAFARNVQFNVACSNWEDYDIYEEEANAVEIAFSLALLPDDVMPFRRFDDRVGFFGSTFTQLGPLPAALVDDDGTVADVDLALDADARVNLIHKWRLEVNASDCDEELCRPVTPITYHLDPSIPEPLWDVIAEGVLSWLPAFEAIGFKDAVKVKRPADADFPPDYDPGDVRFSSVSWLPYPDLGLAIGPSVVDARSGEILYANIVFGEGWIRAFTGSWLAEAELGPSARDASAARRAGRGRGHGYDHGHGHDHGGRREGKRRKGHDKDHGGHDHDHRSCSRSAEETLEGLEAALLVDGAELGAGLPVDFVKDGLKDVVSHEVGHTLGLRHNFKASALYSNAEIHAKSRESRRVASSVMDYIAPVVAEDPSEQGAYFMEGVGVYDAFCIKYGYTPLVGLSAADERAALLAIAALADGDRTLDRADDLDEVLGNDPLARKYDLTADATEWCETQAALTRTLLRRLADGDLPSNAREKLDAVRSRAFEYYRSAASRAIRSWWSKCGTHLPNYVRGLRYDRTNPDVLSAPVSRDSRDRALDPGQEGTRGATLANFKPPLSRSIPTRVATLR